MHLLPCPSCQKSIPVSPSQAGDQVDCPHCKSSVAIPKLGQLRQLPLVEDHAPAEQDRAVESSPWQRSAFLALGLIATASLLIAGFCAIRWSLVDVPVTTDQHIAEIRKQYQQASAAQMIREYEQMEEQGIDMTNPFIYKQAEMKRSKWGKNASIAGAIGGLAVLGAIALAVSGGRKRT